jgi:hypothetical protein
VNGAGANIFTGTIFYGEDVNANLIFYSNSSLSGVTLSGIINVTVAGNDVDFKDIVDKRNGGNTIFPSSDRAEFTMLEISEM